MPKVVRCNVLLAQALEAPADAVCFSYERVVAPNGAGFTIMPNLGGAVEPPASFQPSLPLPVRGDCGQTKSIMSVPRTSPDQYLRSTRSSPAPRFVFETSLSESEGNLVRSWMPRHTLDLSFEGLELPFRECVGASRHKGHRYRKVCPCRVLTPKSGTLVAVLSDLCGDGYAHRDTFFDLQSASLACPHHDNHVEISHSLFGRVLRTSRKRSSCAGQSCSLVNLRPVLWDAV